ncbi:hypothetical protein DV736_g5677, partial [Chaetothyriales sp. CBS 134916]
MVANRNHNNALIPAYILCGSYTESSEFERSRSSLLNLPYEILYAILQHAVVSTGDKIRVSLTCKHLAYLLAQAVRARELPRQVDMTDSSAKIMKRFNFMVGLESVFRDWNQEAKVPHETLQYVGGFVSVAKRLIKYDWRLCSVCLVYRNTTVINPRNRHCGNVLEIVDQTDDWRCVIKKGIKAGVDGGFHNMWICPRHKISPARMVQFRQ